MDRWLLVGTRLINLRRVEEIVFRESYGQTTTYVLDVVLNDAPPIRLMEKPYLSRYHVENAFALIKTSLSDGRVTVISIPGLEEVSPRD